jgi:hypothetical protein
MKYFCFIAFFSGLFFWGCVNPEGNLELKGKVLDDITHVVVPNRKIIVLALVQNDNEFIYRNAGEFSTDSSGRFSYTLKKVKYINFYDFCVVGDSSYVHSNNKLSLIELKRDRKFLCFYVSKLVDLTIKINRKSKMPNHDTLYVSWRSNNILYPFERKNNTMRNTNRVLWVDGDVKSIIKTKVFADKKTVVYWKLHQNGKLNEFTDTISCKRDRAYSVSFNY